jgi:predicted Fe-Mo cluster-binding NifX family protein
MNVAITIWENRISPVFDSSQMLLVVEIKANEVMGKQLIPFNPDNTSLLVEVLGENGVEVLICGAISIEPANLIEACGITLIPFISGDADDVLKSYAKDAAVIPAFLMPGCSRQCRGKYRDRPVQLMRKNKVKAVHGEGEGGALDQLFGKRYSGCQKGMLSRKKIGHRENGSAGPRNVNGKAE